MGHAWNEKNNFFAINRKSRSSAFRNFLFYQNSKYIFWLSYESFSILCDAFHQKGSFPGKTAVYGCPINKSLNCRKGLELDINCRTDLQDFTKKFFLTNEQLLHTFCRNFSIFLVWIMEFSQFFYSLYGCWKITTKGKGCNQLIVWFASATCHNLKLKNLAWEITGVGKIGFANWWHVVISNLLIKP